MRLTITRSPRNARSSPIRRVTQRNGGAEEAGGWRGVVGRVGNSSYRLGQGWRWCVHGHGLEWAEHKGQQDKTVEQPLPQRRWERYVFHLLPPCRNRVTEVRAGQWGAGTGVRAGICPLPYRGQQLNTLPLHYTNAEENSILSPDRDICRAFKEPQREPGRPKAVRPPAESQSGLGCGERGFPGCTDRLPGISRPIRPSW